MAAAVGNVLKVAMVQLRVGANKADNVARAAAAIKTAAANKAQLVALPECFNSPYGTSYFNEYAETIPGPTTEALAEVAREAKVFVIGGSIPERAGEKLYNTCTVFDPEGNMVAKHRKVHLFDIDVPGRIRFQESETLSPGSSCSIFNLGPWRVGVAICYDMRFAELARVSCDNGCNLLVYPGAFNMTTGPAHWELLQRARALDNQLYVATVSPARDETASYIAWGHSSVVDPWGTVVATTEHAEDVVYADLDLERVAAVRAQIPMLSQRRHDLYGVIAKPGFLTETK
eukprot:m.100834 g.100834  ORF g.100834 m.100834 type:complete len:288 (+) comp14077_c0_seq1:17-880(+)